MNQNDSTQRDEFKDMTIIRLTHPFSSYSVFKVSWARALIDSTATAALHLILEQFYNYLCLYFCLYFCWKTIKFYTLFKLSYSQIFGHFLNKLKDIYTMPKSDGF